MFCGCAPLTSTGRPFGFGFLVCTALLLAGVSDTASANGARICKPALAFTDVKFSAVHPETMLRSWTATVLVDASRCASASGRFEILFTREKEDGPELDFIESFEWWPGVVQVAVDFWADEAVAFYRAAAIAACPCAK